MATMKDIADRLGISLSTVSKGLNGGIDISEPLRKTILETAVEMGYTNTRSQKSSRRKVVVCIENMAYQESGDFGFDLVQGFQKAAFQERWAVDVIELTPAFQESNPFDNWMLESKYSGAFLLGLSLDDPWMSLLETTKFPVVLLDNVVSWNSKVTFLGTDPYEGIYMAIHHLAALGHEKIAFLNGSSGSLASDLRMEAYLNAMSMHSLPVDPSWAVYGYYVADAAKYHVPGFLDRGVTAILCGSDLIASGVITCCQEMGLLVPEDISVIGYDDLPLAEHMTPPLTTIRQNRTEIGKSGFYTLYSVMNNIVLSKVLLMPTLVERASTTPARPRIAVPRETWSEDPDSLLKVNPQLLDHFSRRSYI